MNCSMKIQIVRDFLRKMFGKEKNTFSVMLSMQQIILKDFQNHLSKVICRMTSINSSHDKCIKAIARPCKHRIPKQAPQLNVNYSNNVQINIPFNFENEMTTFLTRNIWNLIMHKLQYPVSNR